jgi:hypothetical protein
VFVVLTAISLTFPFIMQTLLLHILYMYTQFATFIKLRIDNPDMVRPWSVSKKNMRERERNETENENILWIAHRFFVVLCVVVGYVLLLLVLCAIHVYTTLLQVQEENKNVTIFI